MEFGFLLRLRVWVLGDFRFFFFHSIFARLLRLNIFPVRLCRRRDHRHGVVVMYRSQVRWYSILTVTSVGTYTFLPSDPALKAGLLRRVYYNIMLAAIRNSFQDDSTMINKHAIHNITTLLYSFVRLRQKIIIFYYKDCTMRRAIVEFGFSLRLMVWVLGVLVFFFLLFRLHFELLLRKHISPTHRRSSRRGHRYDINIVLSLGRFTRV